MESVHIAAKKEEECKNARKERFGTTSAHVRLTPTTNSNNTQEREKRLARAQRFGQPLDGQMRAGAKRSRVGSPTIRTLRHALNLPQVTKANQPRINIQLHSRYPRAPSKAPATSSPPDKEPEFSPADDCECATCPAKEQLQELGEALIKIGTAIRALYPKRALASTLLLFAFLLIMAGDGECSVQTLSNQDLSCVTTPTGLNCTAQYVTSINLIPTDNEVHLIANSEPIISLKTEGVYVICTMEPRSLYSRSIRGNYQMVRRCPGEGSCVDEKCGATLKTDLLTELNESNRHTGSTYCSYGCVWWMKGCDCGLPMPSCIFHRHVAIPTSDHVYEILRCESWRPRVKVEIKVQDTSEERMLVPGFPESLNGATITVQHISDNQLPFLTWPFITNGTHSAVAKDIPVFVQCATRKAASQMDCSVSDETCKCTKSIDAHNITCTCLEQDWSHVLTDPTIRLPYTASNYILQNHLRVLYAKLPMSPIQMRVEMNGKRLDRVYADSLCTINPHHISLANNHRAVDFGHSCYSSQGSIQGLVKCDNGMHWTAICAETEHGNTHTWTPDDEEINSVNTTCFVQCPAGVTNFSISGHWARIAHPHHNNHHRDVIAMASGEHYQGSDMLRNWLNKAKDLTSYSANAVVTAYNKLNALYKTLSTLPDIVFYPSIIIIALLVVKFIRLAIRFTPIHITRKLASKIL